MPREYAPGSRFPGRLGRTVSESEPAWPAPLRAKPGSPNVLFWVIDDVGYGQMSPFGGLVAMPSLERLAAAGLRYTNMHTTALCSPTRACMLTGRNHHSNGLACIAERATGFPGYDARMPLENGMLSEILLQQGYNTFCVGKWHLSPLEESTPAGPYNRWPLGRGFERFYGFLSGETNQWYPDLTHDNHSVSQPKSPEEGYHLSEDLADRANRFILDAHVNAPDKPFFLYYATGAAHAPHHVAPEWIEKYRGRFDMGWDRYREEVFENQKRLGLFPPEAELSRLDPDVPRWDSLSPEQQRLAARMMEVYAGFLEHADHHFGRILDTLERIGELDNTLIMVVPDNGASSEGGPVGAFNEFGWFNNRFETLEEVLPRIDELGGTGAYNHYPWGWAWAGNTPFRRWKKEVYRGGCTDSLIVHWPAGIQARGELRHQYAHAIDMVPTVLEALGVEPPATVRGVTQNPIEGVSFAHSFDAPEAESRHRTQYYEMYGNRALYHEGWRANCGFPGPSYAEGEAKGYHRDMEITPEILHDLDRHGWELYNVADDPAECHNLAADHPDRLQELITLWWSEAGRYQVLPLDGRIAPRAMVERPQITADRNRFVFYPDLSVMPMGSAPRVCNRPHSITAEVTLPAHGAEGVLLAQGGVTGGYVLFIKERRLQYTHNYLGLKEYSVCAPDPLPSGRHMLRFEFEPTTPPDLSQGLGAAGHARLYVDGVRVAQELFDTTTPIVFGLEGLSCGYDFGEAVSSAYRAPFRFSGEIHELVMDLSGDLILDSEAEARRLMAQQ